MRKTVIVTAMILACVVPACSSFAQPTASVVPTSIFTPPSPPAALALTHAALPPTATAEAVSTFVPEGQLASEWNGIPLMPGAIVGEGDDESYIFTIGATSRQVQEYYELELAKLGWQPVAQEDNDSSIMLMFVKDDTATLTISILSKDDQTLVLLVK